MIRQPWAVDGRAQERNSHRSNSYVVESSWLLQVLVKECEVSAGIWEFPKIGDPNIAPEIVGSLF